METTSPPSRVCPTQSILARVRIRLLAVPAGRCHIHAREVERILTLRENKNAVAQNGREQIAML
jgi:hypothetical protein